MNAKEETKSCGQCNFLETQFTEGASSKESGSEQRIASGSTKNARIGVL